MPETPKSEIRAAGPALGLSPTAGPPLPPLPEGVSTIMHDWMAERAPKWLAGLYFWPAYRLFGRCLASGCPVPSQLNILHPPGQLHRCENTPLNIGITLRGWLLAKGMDPGVLDAWCESRGLDPGAVVEPIQVDPASVA